MKRGMIFLLYFIQLILISSAFAQTPEITNGLNYLSSTQNPDGSWSGTVTRGMFPTSLASIETLSLLGQGNTEGYSNTVTWLQSQNLETTDYLAKRIHALSTPGTDLDLALSYIDGVYTGAWCGYKDYEVNILDTALIISALKTINYPDLDTISIALFYLTYNQNADGGFGSYAGDDSSVYMTAVNLNALISYSDVFDFESEINNAVAYLLAHQNPDGSFATSTGSGQGTVYETALAFEALIASGSVGAENYAALQNAIDYLTSTQLPNGSWNDDPYSTALALRALAYVKPNLSITSSDITFSNQNPTRGEIVTVTASIHNTGLSQTDNVLVQFYDGDPNSGGTQIGSDQIIATIAPYNTASVSITYDTTGKLGRHDIFVMADQMNAIDEASETDNSASSFVTINTLPDIYIDSGEITYTPVNPTPDDPLHITFKVRNLGEKSLTNVLTKLYKGIPGQGGIAIDSYTIQILPGRGAYGVIASFYAPDPGVNTYYLVADPDNTVVETNESNNSGGVTILVGVSEDEDLVIYPNNISFTRPQGANPGDPIFINAVISNTGSTTVNIDVDFYNSDPSAGGVLIGRTAATVPSLGNTLARMPWTLPEANTAVYVVVDPDNRIPETNEANNIAYRALAPTLPDIRLDDADVTYSPRYPTPKSEITIEATLRNYGEAEASPPQVFLYEGAPENGGTYVTRATTLDPVVIQPLSYSTATIILNSFPAGVHEFYVIADPNNTIDEIHENNNRARIEIAIGNDPKTDLFIAENDITFSPALPLTGQQVTITATVHNSGSEYTSNFPVAIYNGNPAEGGTLIKKTSIWAPQEGIKKVTATYTMTSGTPEIFVVADEGNTITETSEANNIASKTIDTYRVDLFVSPGDISLKPVLPAAGDTESIEVEVHSRGIINTSATLNLYEGTPETSRLIGSQGFSIIGGQAVTLTFPSYIYTGDGDMLTAVIENAAPAEDDITNNRATAVFGEQIQDGASNEGTDFWVAFPDVYYSTARIVVQSRHIANVAVKTPSFTWQGQVSPGFPAVVPIIAGSYYNLDKIRSDSVVGDSGIHITSDQDVSVVFHTPNIPDYADDSYLALPVNMLGTEYYVLSYTSSSANAYPAFYVVIATEENTNVSINGTIINMNKGQTYQVKKNALDHSGTHILSDKPIAVIAGTKCSNVTATPVVRTCDSLLEEMLPVSIMGTDHYTAPLYSPGSTDVFRVLAARDNTEVTVKDKYYTKTYNLNAGQWIEYENEMATHITSTGPIMVAQFAKGSDAALVGDPFQMTIIPTDKLKTEYRFFIHAGYEEGDFFTVIAPEPGTSVMLDGIPLNTGWSPLPDKGSYLVIPIDIGEHVVTSDKPVAVYAHGYRLDGSYAYPAGIALHASNLAVSNLAATPQNPSEGQLVEITAILSNEGDKWAKDIVVKAYNGDPAQGGIQIGEDFHLDILYPKESKTANFTWDTRGYGGINNIYIVADPLNTIRESNEMDNITMMIVEVIFPVKPDLSVIAQDITLSAGLVNEGETVTLTANIKNRGMNVGDVPVSLYLGDPAAGGLLIGDTIIREIIPFYGETTVTFTINTIGLSDINSIFVVIDPQNTIAEIIETNNKAFTTLRVNRNKLSLDVITDKTEYRSRSDVGIEVTIRNESIVPWSGTGEIYIEDTSGNRIAHATTFSINDLKPMGMEGWFYRAPITVIKTEEMKDAIALARINFNDLFSSLGISGKTIDINSIRVLEFNGIGNFVGEKKARFDKNNGFEIITNPSGRLLWLMDGFTPANSTRYFYLYFDTTENGTKPSSTSTELPEKGRLIAFSGYWGDIYTVTSKGDGTFGSKVPVTKVNMSLLNGIAIDDFDNDSFPDIISGDEYNDIYYFKNRADGSNTFLPASKIGNISSGTVLQSVTSADYNGDGYRDFILNMSRSTTLHLFSGNGDGTFTQSTIPGPSASSLNGKASADFDRDGKADLAVGDDIGRVSIYYGNGDGTFTLPVEIGKAGDSYGMTAGDFDSNGYTEIIVTYGTTYIIKGIFDREVKPLIEQVPSLNTNNRAALYAVDINGDTNLDLLVAQYTTGQLFYFEGNGDNTFKTPTEIASNAYYLTSASASRMNPEVIAGIGAPEKIESTQYHFIWNTGNTLPGGYKVHVTLSGGQGVIAEDYATFEILPDVRVDSNIVTDKVSYYANEPLTITSTVTSLSENAFLENLTAAVTVTNGQGTVLFTESNSLPLLTPSGITELKAYWNTATNPPGDYPVTLEVKDSTGNVLSTSTATLVITSEIKPSKLLSGEISVDRQSILQGEPLAITYDITNVGNIDLPEINLSIPIVHVVELTPYDTLIDQTALLMSGTYTNTQTLNTQNYTAKDYLVILRANISGIEETLASTYFRVEGAPSSPSLNWPSEAEDIETLTPSLTVNNAADPNDDELTYEFELYSDSGLVNLIASSDMIAEGQNITSWTVPLNLTENSRYYWRARAYDGLLYGEWMTPASFRVNLTNEPPTAPTLSSPADDSDIDTLTPLLVVNNAFDPDSENLTYNFELALDADFTQIISNEIGIFEGEGITSWQVLLTLNENTYYYWRAQADDWLIEGPWMIPAGFFVNTANDAPTAPVIISPSSGSEVPSLSADMVITNSTDPDSTNLTYIFEIDTVNTFDSQNLVSSGNIPEAQGTTTWHVDNLTDNTLYYVRAKASDGFAESQWSEVISFFVNTLNDAPTAPVLSNPSDGSGVNTFTPALSVHNSSDIDGDILTYEFELYDDYLVINPISVIAGVVETAQITSWTVPVNLTENKNYYWRARAFDGELNSGWMIPASFMVNTANDAPTAPALNSPAEGISLNTLTPSLSVYNASDPDSDILTYDFEIYSNGVLIQSITGIPQNASGITSVALSTALSDNTVYNWRARAYDGDRYGAWMNMAAFSTHLPSTNITATIEVEPETLNQKSQGKWVTVEIELPHGYRAADIDVASIRLNGIVPAELRPFSIECEHEHEHERGHEYEQEDNCEHEHDRSELKVKFRRSEVIAILPAGERVRVIVTGTVGTTTFEGFDRIRVIH